MLHFWAGLVTGIFLVVFLAAGFVACTGGSNSTGPSAEASWHGNRLVGAYPIETFQAFEAAWSEVNQRFPAWVPVGWTIISHDAPFPCPELGICDGRMVGPTREIHVGWGSGGAKRLVEVAKWELCNAARWELSGKPRQAVDRGCAR